MLTQRGYPMLSKRLAEVVETFLPYEDFVAAVTAFANGLPAQVEAAKRGGAPFELWASETEAFLGAARICLERCVPDLVLPLAPGYQHHAIELILDVGAKVARSMNQLIAPGDIHRQRQFDLQFQALRQGVDRACVHLLETQPEPTELSLAALAVPAPIITPRLAQCAGHVNSSLEVLIWSAEDYVIAASERLDAMHGRPHPGWPFFAVEDFAQAMELAAARCDPSHPNAFPAAKRMLALQVLPVICQDLFGRVSNLRGWTPDAMTVITDQLQRVAAAFNGEGQRSLRGGDPLPPNWPPHGRPLARGWEGLTLA